MPSIDFSDNEIKALIQIIENSSINGKSVLFVADLLKKLQSNTNSIMRVKDLKNSNK